MQTKLSNDERIRFAIHTFAPVSDGNSRILILGTMPSVGSQEAGFYYGHPRNRFWQVLADSFSAPVPHSIEQKTRLLLENRVALWDVVASCEIVRSDDSSIRKPVFNDIPGFICGTPIQKILCNGRKSYDLFRRSCGAAVPALHMPSTSPANAAWSARQLTEAWKAELTAENLH